MYCEECGEKYTSIYDKWCKPCQMDGLKKNFANWTSGNEKIDNFIQEMQLKIKYSFDRIVEWIPYDQFNNIKEIRNDDFVALFSAIWKNGSLYYDKYEKIYKRNSKNQEVILRCYNSQNIPNEFFHFHMVQNFFINLSYFIFF